MPDGRPVGRLRFRQAEWPFADLRTDPFGLRGQFPRGSAMALRTDDPAVIASGLLVLEGWASEIELLPAERVDHASQISGVPSWSSGVLTEAHPTARHTWWTLRTSGTTGEPKRIAHPLDSLDRTARDAKADPARVWGLLYPPTRMAGLQVLLHCLRTDESLVAPDLAVRLPTQVSALVEGGVTALSATPTAWRRMLQLGIDGTWPLQQITLGGEIADQSLLDELRSRFPSARITHVFAATESGVAFSVSDDRAGFPLDLLSEYGGDGRLRVTAGSLEVRNPLSTAAASDGYVRTGDRVEIIGDRIHFLGRDSGLVNVAGTNVSTEHVERILRQHPDVVDALVTTRPSAFAGNVLVAEVVLRGQADASTLRRWVRQAATPAHVPARVSVVGAIATTETGKARRS